MTGRETVSDESLATAPVFSRRRCHYPGLDGMRGVGVLAVLFVHFVGVDPADPRFRGTAPFLIDLVAFVFGIPLFFVLSGFLITGILLEAREKPCYFRNFFVRRILRIFPLYYGVLIVLFVIRPEWGHAVGGVSSPRWLWTYLSNWELARHGHWTYGYLSHLWSLAVEEQYYFVWPLVVLLFGPKRLLIVCAVLGASAVTLRIALTAGWKHLVAGYVLTPCELDPLCAGGALAVLVRRWPLKRLQALARFAIAGSLATYVVLGWYRHARNSREQVVGRPLVSSFLFGGVLLLAIGESGLLRGLLASRPATFLGKYSYGLYVFHFLLVPCFGLCFPRAGLGRALGSPAAGIVSSVALSMAATLLIAIASYELFEKHFLKLKARFGP